MNLPELPWPPASGRAVPLRITLQENDGGSSLPDNVLCAFQAQAARDDDPRRVTVPLHPLLGAERTELWLADAPVRNGRYGAIGWAASGDVLMLQVQVPEARLEPLEDTACALYRQIAAFAGARGYAHFWRVWHYLGGITQGEGDAERYRRFCAGRHRAFAAQPGFEAQVPAATAIGPAHGGLLLVALAGRQPGRQVENPAQTSAFRYPRAYGPRSPSFSRAILLPGDGGARLLVSGTASIVGHVSVFPGELAAQLRQIAENLATLTAYAQGMHAAGGRLRALSRTLYLRHAADLPAVRAQLGALFGDAPLRVFAGDICRRELLAEVEAVYGDAG